MLIIISRVACLVVVATELENLSIITRMIVWWFCFSLIHTKENQCFYKSYVSGNATMRFLFRFHCYIFWEIAERERGRIIISLCLLKFGLSSYLVTLIDVLDVWTTLSIFNTLSEMDQSMSEHCRLLISHFYFMSMGNFYKGPVTRLMQGDIETTALNPYKQQDVIPGPRKIEL